MSNTPIELKGSSFTLSVVHLHEAEPKVIHQALEDKIAQAPAFLKHAPVVLNVKRLNPEGQRATSFLPYSVLLHVGFT